MRVAVPPRVARQIAQTEIAADVDERSTFLQPGRCELRRLPCRERGDDDFRVADIGADDERGRSTVQMRLDVAQWLALMGPGHGRHELDLGVAQEDPGELSARVAGDPDDGDACRHAWIIQPLG